MLKADLSTLRSSLACLEWAWARTLDLSQLTLVAAGADNQAPPVTNQA